jgi:hypothetical protein
LSEGLAEPSDSVPQYRRFEYFLVEDEIVIVDPHTMEIIAIITAALVGRN